MLHAMHYPITAQEDSFIYVIMNSNRANAQIQAIHGLSFQAFNTVTRTWALQQPIPSQIKGTRGASAICLNGKMYVVGGDSRICLEFNPQSNAWSVLVPPSLTHIYGCAVVYSGNILLLGGAKDTNLNELSNKVEQYDPEGDSWTLSHIQLPARMMKFFATIMDI
jgi:N-acetylneuraminic acid mutarotase